MSVWENIESLHHYVYRSAHNQIMAKRKLWFETIREAFSVLWWIPGGHVPTIEEAADRLETLKTKGPCPAAFTFKQHYPPA
jgi:hypothetical protein